MKVVIQRVHSAQVIVNGEIKSSIKKGLSLLIGFTHDDEQKDIDYMAKKIVDLRLFDDDELNRRWDLSVKSKNYELLCISQYTLYNKLKGNKVDFHHAMKTEDAEKMYYKFIDKIKQLYNPDLVKDGVFGIYRTISLEIDGPVTICLDSKKTES